MFTKNQIVERLQELDELHEFTPAEQREFDTLENSLMDIYAQEALEESHGRASNIAAIVAREIMGNL